jgi:hypothetical protein
VAKRTRKPTRKAQARRRLPVKLTRKLTPGFVIAIRFPESIIADTVCYIGEKKVWFDPDKGVIGRSESRVTDYNLSNLTDAHIYQHRFDVERELSYVMSFLKGKRGLDSGSAQIERVRWVPKEVISTNRKLRNVKKYPAIPSQKLKVKVLERKYEIPVPTPDVNRLLAIAQESIQRESQIIQP